jgi:hypothetical protein
MVDQQEVEAFVADPGSWADPALAAPLIAPGLRAETAQRLLASPRLARRASRLLADRLGCGDAATLEPVDLALASAPRAVLEAVALRAGAVWHARRVRAIVLGADIALLCTRLGDATRNAALRHGALAPLKGNSPDIDGAGGNGAGGLPDDILRDGTHCLSAWIDALPDWVASRVRLKFQTGPVLTGSTGRHASAVRIVRTLAAEELAV